MNIINQASLLFISLFVSSMGSLASAAPSLPMATAGLNQASQLINQPSEPLSQGQLAQLLAPIALYPDTVLTHVLISAAYPMDVVQAERWLNQRQGISQSSLINSAETEPWDPSIKALLAFPSLLQKMSQDLAWTQALGEAFVQNEARVLDAIQVLRQQAYDADNLNELQNMRVRRVEKHIIIEPIQTQVIYLPYYDSRYIYGNWHWQQHPPHYWHRSTYISSSRYIVGSSHRGHIYWDTGVNIGVNFFFSAFHWHKRHVVVTSHHNSHHYQRPLQIVTSPGARHWHHNSDHRANHRSSMSNGDGGLSRKHSTSVGGHGAQQFNRHLPTQKQLPSVYHQPRYRASQSQGSQSHQEREHASHAQDNRSRLSLSPVRAAKIREYAQPIRQQQRQPSHHNQRNESQRSRSENGDRQHSSKERHRNSSKER
ncbi:DUF3300 domain-containing protein [Shewanella sp.]|uniref:DUF3300 domain-containing protein n=1 Tax=Shewanella sp. TaxID=50422 RepID=UPI0040540157